VVVRLKLTVHFIGLGPMPNCYLPPCIKALFELVHTNQVALTIL